jgi:hypothetical protein
MPIVVACLLLSSCGSVTGNVELAKSAVVQFHSQLDTEQYSAVYATTDNKFHNFTGEADFTRLLEAVHRKLGTVRGSSLRNMNVGWFAGQGATVTLVYDTTFSSGSGTEEFVWHIADDRALLYGYHINSNDLITK